MLKKIVEDIKLAQIFTVMMDETTGVSGKEQASIMVRFVDSEENTQKHPMGLSAVSRTDAHTLFTVLKDSLTSHGLSLSQGRGQCYDGASNMSGQYSGLQARVKLESLKALSVCIVMHTASI